MSNLSLLNETIRLTTRELEAAQDVNDGTEDLERILDNLKRLKRSEESALDGVFSKLESLAKGAEARAKDLLRLAQESVPHCQLRDIHGLASVSRKADVFYQTARAYRWALHNIKIQELGVDYCSEEEFDRHQRNHPED